MSYPIKERIVSVRIPAGNSRQSGSVDLLGGRLVGLQMPSPWTAANITFLGTATFDDNLVSPSIWDPVYSSNGDEVEVMVSNSRIIGIDPKIMLPFRFLRLRSGTSATPVNQVAARTILLIVWPF